MVELQASANNANTVSPHVVKSLLVQIKFNRNNNAFYIATF
jgi:hypothetical protein